MTDNLSTLASITGRARIIDADAAVVGVHFLGETAVFVLGESSLLLVAGEGEARRIAVHDGGILASASDGKVIVTGGDDGKVVATAGDGAVRAIATDPKRRWIDHVALGPDGAIAWSAGKTAFVRILKRGQPQERSCDAASTVGGFAFMPKGLRLAIAHYNGTSLWFPNSDAAPDLLDWKGAHLGITISPDGKFVVTAMQEPALHGWRLDDRKHMRMTGYSSRVRSMTWTAGERFLATAGAAQLILWPFQSKDGPMGKSPRLLAPYQTRVTAVAAHPRQDIVATGYADGLLLLVRISDGGEILAKRPGGSPLSALAWDDNGTHLAFGTDAGEAGVIAV